MVGNHVSEKCSHDTVEAMDASVLFSFGAVHSVGVGSVDHNFKGEMEADPVLSELKYAKVQIKANEG